MKQLGPTGRIFFYLIYVFHKYAEKIQISSKCDKNNRYFAWRRVHIYDYISLDSS
jgi:hypothetical protein